MMKALLFLFVVNTAGAATLNPFSCLGMLSSKMESTRTSAQAGFNQVILKIRAAGAKELLAPLDNGAIQPVFKGIRMPWQSMVSGREGWTGKLTLKVRAVDFADEKEAQKAVWETAMALFELETRAALWSRRSVLSTDDKKEFDLSLQGSDESFEYFMYTQPREWRDQQVKRIEVLESELYGLLGTLDQLKPADILPEKDPGRWWKLRLIFGGDGSKAIAPNQADYDKYRGLTGANAEQRPRRERSLLFNYYMNFMKRAVILSLLAQVGASLPSMQNVPSYLDAMFAFGKYTKELSESPSKTAEFNQRYLENVKKNVRVEEGRLDKAIAAQKSAANPDEKRIESLEKELSDLHDLYPWLAHSK